MFDISFAEMLVVGVVALIVLGPERLPRVARTLGHLFGRAQRYMNDVKNDIQREIELEELKRLKTSVEDTARSIEEAARTEIRQFQQDVAATDTKNESESINPSPSADDPAADSPAADSPITGRPTAGAPHPDASQDSAHRTPPVHSSEPGCEWKEEAAATNVSVKN